MRYRPLDAHGDYTIGKPFLVNSPQCVGQAVLTRMKLWLGEWFMDTSDGTPYLTQVLGKGSQRNPDAYIKQRILSTQGVDSIASYTGTLDRVKRAYSVTTVINTIYGQAEIAATLAIQ